MCVLIAELTSPVPGPIDVLLFGGIPACISACYACRDARRQTFSLHSPLMVVVACTITYFFLTLFMGSARSSGITLEDALPPSVFIAVVSLFLGVAASVPVYAMMYRQCSWYVRKRFGRR